MTIQGNEASTFGATLRSLRRTRSLTLEQVAQQLESAGGEKVTTQAVSNWERGGRTNYENAKALEVVLDAPGELAHLLGFRGDEDKLRTRLDAVEAALAEVKANQKAMADALTRLSDEVSRRPGTE